LEFAFQRAELVAAPLHESIHAAEPDAYAELAAVSAAHTVCPLDTVFTGWRIIARGSKPMPLQAAFQEAQAQGRQV
jgi:hypothetical protein